MASPNFNTPELRSMVALIEKNAQTITHLSIRLRTLKSFSISICEEHTKADILSTELEIEELQKIHHEMMTYRAELHHAQEELYYQTHEKPVYANNVIMGYTKDHLLK